MTASAVILSRGKMRTRPVCTLVAEMKSCRSVVARSFSKSTKRSIRSFSGLMLSGLTSYGEKYRDIASNQACTGVPSMRRERQQPLHHLALQRRQIAGARHRAPEIGEPFLRFRAAAASQAVGQHHRIDRARRRAGNALDREPFVAQELSSTPQVKAPCAPPPCSARLMRLVGDAALFVRRAAGQQRCERIFFMRPAVRPEAAADYSAVQPPSIERLAPVIALAASEHR